MRGRKSVIVLALSSLWLAGCATSALEMAPARPDQPWTPATTADGEIIAGQRETPNVSGGYVLPANRALAMVSPPPALVPGRAYALPALIDLAERTNPATRVAWNDARRVALAAGIAESTYLPRLTAMAIGGYQGSDGHDAALGTQIDDSGSVHGMASILSLQWLLFDFGERAAIVDAAKQASVISNIAFTEAHQQVIYNVTLAFYAHAAAQAHLATAIQSLKNAQIVQAAAQDRYKHGIGTVIETAQARQATAQANLALVRAKGRAQDAYLALMTAMGISPLTKIKVAGISDRQLSPAMATPVEGIIATSLARRPDVLGAYAALQASLANERAAHAEFMPKIFLSANGSYNSGGVDVSGLPSADPQSPNVNIDGNRLGGAIIAGATIPLYDGGTRAAKLAQAQAAADSADAKLTRVREDAVRQIVLADNDLRTDLSAYAASQSLAVAAQTTFDAALSAYRSGVGSITDLTLAESQLLQAKNASSDAYDDALSAAATLALATGTLGAAPQ